MDQCTKEIGSMGFLRDKGHCISLMDQDIKVHGKGASTTVTEYTLQNQKPPMMECGLKVCITDKVLLLGLMVAITQGNGSIVKKMVMENSWELMVKLMRETG